MAKSHGILFLRSALGHGDDAAIHRAPREDPIVAKAFVVHARRRSTAAKAGFGGGIKAFPDAVASPGDAAASP
jgi:hypothetical protein